VAARKPVSSESAPTAIGPYSPAIRSGALFLSSGQLGLDPATGALVPGGTAAETKQAILNLQRLLEAAGGSLADILKTTVYLRDLGDFTQMNSIYAEFFPHEPPARTTIQAAALPKSAAVEIEGIAMLPARKKPVRRRK
jgi:2-iminobutanoate/2-iminopropanoate deaminase